VLSQNSARIWFDFTEGNGLHSGPFKAKAKPADAGKQIKNAHQTRTWQSGPRQTAHRPSCAGTILH
jgi:hypothetical protein